MADVFTKAKRSAVMSLIRGSGNNDTELRMIALFREHWITGWRRNARVFGRPDFVFRKQHLALFVDGVSGTAAQSMRRNQKTTRLFGGVNSRQTMPAIGL